jgi:peptidoglycan/LPS O-acetylase OafA/YrhL
MINGMKPTTLARWTAALLAISALFFALAVVMERSGESRETSAPGAQLEAGEAGAPTGAGGSAEGKALAETPQLEATEGGKGIQPAEEIFGVNLESPWLVWGFVGVSLVLAVAVLRFGKPALVVAIVLAGAAALLDTREVFFQFGRANLPIAGIALLIALAHATAAILALMAWRAPQAEGQAGSKANGR